MTDNKKNALRDIAKRTDMFRIDPRLIEIEEGHNPRDYNLAENRAHLDELKASIAVQGVRLPVSVRHEQATDRIILVDGECRIRACLELIKDGTDIKTVPAIVVKGTNEKDRLYLALTANTGKPLSAWESGRAFQRLINFGDTEENIAKQLGYSLRFVKEALELSDAPEAVKELLSQEAVTPSLALSELRSKAVPEAIESLKQKAKEAKESGQKIARKKQENRLPDAKTMINLISKLVESVQDDLFDDEYKFAEVDKGTLRKLAKLVGIENKEKTAA